MATVRTYGPPASAPAMRQQFNFGRKAERITVATRLRNSIIQEAPDSDDDEGQFATVRDDGSDIPSITIQSASSYKGSPATARVPSFAWEHQISQSIDQQLRAAPAIASRGELARLAAARRMHNRRSQSMYLSSETPATPPLSPPNDGYSNLTSPAPFTSAISPLPFMPQFAHMGMMMMPQQMMMPMMPMTAAPAPRVQQHRRSTSATHGRAERRGSTGSAAALPSLDEIRVLFEKRKAAAAATKGEELKKKAEAEQGKKTKDDKGEKSAEEEEEKEATKPKEETDRERRASGLKVLKRRSLALQTTDLAAAAPTGSPKTASPATPAKPQQLTPILTDMPKIKVQEPGETTAGAGTSPAVSPASTKRPRPLSLQVPPASAFAGLPTVLRSPEPPKNLLALRGQGADRSAAARSMMKRLSLSNRVVLAA